MSAREFAITVLGLVATFCMPWPGEPSRSQHGIEHARLLAAACVGACQESAIRAPRVRAQDQRE